MPVETLIFLYDTVMVIKLMLVRLVEHTVRIMESYVRLLNFVQVTSMKETTWKD